MTEPREGLVVSGVGTVSVVPDMATVHFAASADSEHIGDAMDRASAAAAKMVEALAAAGVEERDRHTHGMNLESWHEEEPRRPRCHASQRLVVRLRDISSVSDRQTFRSSGRDVLTVGHEGSRSGGRRARRRRRAQGVVRLGRLTGVRVARRGYPRARPSLNRSRPVNPKRATAIWPTRHAPSVPTSTTPIPRSQPRREEPSPGCAGIRRFER